MELIPLERRAATLDLVMLIIETTDRLPHLSASTPTCRCSTIARMAGHFHTLLESVIRESATAIDDLDILTGSDAGNC